MSSPAAIANPFPLGTRVATGNPPPMVPTRPLASVHSQAWGGVPAAPQPQRVAAQLQAAAAGGSETVNIGGTLVTVEGTSVGGLQIGGTTIGGASYSLNLPPGADLAAVLEAIMGSLTPGGGCNDCS